MRAWEREKRTLARIYKGVTKRKTKIIDIPAKTGKLGFTSADGNIHLAQEHPIMDGLDADEKKFFRMGVFAHEMLHQIYSDFQVLKETQTSLNPMERQIYANLFNLIEDPAIEFMAPSVIGGSILKALRFMIQTMYQKTPDIDESPEGFTQYHNALVMFGDKGIIKGHFTDELAADMFQRTCGRFNEAVENPDPKFRSDAALELMEETRPLWESFSNDDLKKMLESFPDHESESTPGGIGIPMPAGGKKSDSASEARKKIVSSMEEPMETGPEKETEPEKGAKPEKEAGSETDEKAETDEKTGSGETEDSFSFEDDATGDDKTDSSSSDGPKTNDTSTSDTSDDDGFDFEEPDVSPDTDETREETSSTDSKDDKHMDDINEKLDDSDDMEDADEDREETPSTDSKNSNMDDINEKLDNADDMEDITVDEKDLNWMDEADETSEKELRAEEKEAEKPVIDESIEPNFYPKGKYSMKNFNVNIAEHAIEAYAERYGEVLQKYAVSRSSFVKRLKRIFDTDRAKKEYKKSGKVNIKRYTGSRKTARIFERRTSPKGIDDLAITILVDESGSMREGYVPRYQIARECTIMLAESFADLKIPVYVLGFSADEYEYHAEHYHYIKWKNTLKERYRLLQIQARANNFDSLSVNYASEILKKRRAEHKLLIVISDGVPACSAIGFKQGLADTKESIRMARKNMDVLGIAVGNDCTEQIQYLYGKNFLHITDVNAAFASISKEIADIVKRW